jgi:hypothetical protein
MLIALIVAIVLLVACQVAWWFDAKKLTEERDDFRRQRDATLAREEELKKQFHVGRAATGKRSLHADDLPEIFHG